MWKDEFVSIMSGATISLKDIEKAIALKNANLPSKIYKYCRINPYSLDNFSSDTLWLCGPEAYNDPYECYTTMDFERLHNHYQCENFDTLTSRDSLKKYLTKENLLQIRSAKDPVRKLAYALLEKDESISREKHEEMVEALIKISVDLNSEYYQNFHRLLQRGMKVCSFSERLDSIVMWSHYSDSHKGFCLEYDLDQLEPDDIRRRILFPVVYSDQVFDATKYFLQAAKHKDFNNLYGMMATIHKSPDWAYEKEWRFVLAMGEAHENWNYTMPTPSAIYLGTRIKQSDKDLLTRMAEKKDVPVYDMVVMPSAFRLMPKQA